MTKLTHHKSSFRDNAGAVYTHGGRIFRSVTKYGKDDYQYFVSSGLKQELLRNNCLIPFKETSRVVIPEAWKTLDVDTIPFVSYPYEWSFDMYKEVAKLLLTIQLIALSKNMILKDASAYNMQIYQGKPILIDLLSFEKYTEGQPWNAYGQFCRHFLAPLALMSKTDIRLGSLQQIWIDGIPLDLAHKLLPWRTKLDPALAVHLHIHGYLYNRYDRNEAVLQNLGSRKVSKQTLIHLAMNLRDVIDRLDAPTTKSRWSDYIHTHQYSRNAFLLKQRTVRNICKSAKPKLTLDVGANIGTISDIAAEHSNFVVAVDNDPLATQIHYQSIRDSGKRNILPLTIDVTNPSPSIGWNNDERSSFFTRGRYDLVIALALMHHLVIGNNIPLVRLAELFARISARLLIEFIPKSDPNVTALLHHRRDIFTSYSSEEFEKKFKSYFDLQSVIPVPGSDRLLYYFVNKKV